MPETSPGEQLRAWVLSSLHLAAPHLYQRRPNGDLQYDGTRPGSDWHAHGYFPRMLFVLDLGRVVRILLWKRRWKRIGTTHTQHSRPPDDAASVWSCLLIVVAVLWACLDSAHGLVHREHHEVLPGLSEHVSVRTKQRWLDRALRHASESHQAVRTAVIERSEPRPVEKLFPGGLPPPEGLRRRPWRDLPTIVQVWQTLARLMGGAVKLETPVAILLAEARGRLGNPQDRFVI